MQETNFGGAPVKGVGETFEWPTCQSCEGNMQYLGKVKADLGLEQIFMCQNDPGLCEEYAADYGGNRVVITRATELEAVAIPEEGIVVRGIEHGCEVAEYDSNDYDEAREKWAEEKQVAGRAVLGQLFGSPEWIQGDETPECDQCKKPMRFVAQLEEGYGADVKADMNFGGGGCAYLFDCSCNLTAKFLWQC